MEINRKDRVELKITIEDRDYVLFVPVGAQLLEAKEISLAFASAFNTAWETYSKKKLEDEAKEVSEKEIIVDEHVHASPSSS